MFFFKVTIFIAYATFCFSKKYNNYTLFQSVPHTLKELNYLKTLSAMPDYIFWRHPHVLYKPVEFLVGPNSRKSFLRQSIIYKLETKTLIEDIQRAFDDQTVKSYFGRRKDNFNWQHYYRTDDIYDWLRDLKTSYPNVVDLMTIGTTYEHRDILVARVSINWNAKSNVIIEGGIHAREWLGVSCVTYLLNQILTSPKSCDKDLNDIARAHNWYFIPVINPDGYEYTHTEDRLYRKNLRQVDLNRNFDYAFETVGVSFDPDSEIYCGPKAFSEVESQALRDFVTSKRNGLTYYLAFHAYGQVMIIPYGNTTEHLDNYDTVKMKTDIVTRRIRYKYNNYYLSGTGYETISRMISGDSASWVKKTFGVPYVLTLELRDQGQYGFALPPQSILPACREITDAIITFMLPLNSKSVRINENKSTRQEASTLLIIFAYFLLNNMIVCK